MAKLWFSNALGERRVIAECNTFADVMTEIDKFIADANDRWPKKKPFKRYYTRIWEEDGRIKIDIGSWSEFFYTEKKILEENIQNPG